MLKLKQRVKTYVAFNSSHFGVIMTIYFTYLSELLFLQTFFSPWRIVDDCGGAFTMGAIGGSVFQSIKGFRNAPSVS